jgi:hypothetical protein
MSSSAEENKKNASLFPSLNEETAVETDSSTTLDYTQILNSEFGETDSTKAAFEESEDNSFAGDEVKAGNKLFEPESGFEIASATENFAAPKPPVDEMEFYRRRAIDEVTSLQMVEHVFSGVEREQMRILPKPFNDIAVKKALHDFLQVSKNSPANENAQAEFKLMQETESWCSALSHRDKHLSVSALRRYCETTKPVLSNQALVALARFYRNLPHNESVRSKFDMVLTRMFTKEAGGEKRELLFSREEIIKQINELYADWASVPLYSVEDETELLLTTVKFDDFLAEAQGAENFDELVKNDFYNRLRLFKESTGDNFYAPPVLASAIESNVLIGNRYVELLENERRKSSAEAIESQYSFLLDQAISDATSKTLQLVELLKEKSENVAEPKKLDEAKETLDVPKTTVEYKKPKQSKVSFFGVSPWLVIVLLSIIVLSGSLYLYVEYFSQPKVSPNVQKVNLENSFLKDYLQAARIDQDTFIGVVSQSWDNTTEDKKLEMVSKVLSFGKEKGFKKVHLLNTKGETVGHATETETKLINPASN